MSTSVKLRQVEFHQVDAWEAKIAQPGEDTITRYYPFAGGEWADLARQTMGTCDFRAGSERRKAWSRIRRLYAEEVPG